MDPVKYHLIYVVAISMNITDMAYWCNNNSIVGYIGSTATIQCTRCCKSFAVPTARPKGMLKRKGDNSFSALFWTEETKMILTCVYPVMSHFELSKISNNKLQNTGKNRQHAMDYIIKCFTATDLRHTSS